MDTKPLERFAQSARRQLHEQVAARLERVLRTDSAELRGQAAAIAELQRQIAASSRQAVIERVAYTWFNRFCALRFMDVHGYTGMGVVSPAAGYTQPEILLEAKQGHIDDDLGPPARRQAILDLLAGRAPSRDPQGEAYRLLLVAACNAWHDAMPFLFERIDDYSELLAPDDLLSAGSILHGVREAMTPERCQDVEIIGWLYQFYISEKKDQVIGARQKIKAEDIPAATQLFTPHWIVRFLVENSLGRLWLLNHPESKLAERMDYYIGEPSSVNGNRLTVNGEPSGTDHGVPFTDYLRIHSPEELRVGDPAAGSGHMLTYAFDLLYLIYEEQGYNPREIPRLILEHNLVGMEIDERAAALAAFALAMKARAKDSRFLRRGVHPHIVVLRPIAFRDDELQPLLGGMVDALMLRAKARKDARPALREALLHDLHLWAEADNFGSLLRPQLSAEQIAAVRTHVAALAAGPQRDLVVEELRGRLLQALAQAEALSRPCHVVVANPPYMGSRSMNSSVAEFVSGHYDGFSADLFSAFAVRIMEITAAGGFIGIMTPFTWMFLNSYEALRHRILTETTLTSLVRPEYHAFFDSAFVPICAFTLHNRSVRNFQGTFIDLTEFYGADLQPIKALEAISDPLCSWRFLASADDFDVIPGSPIAYWVSPNLRSTYHEAQLLSEILNAKTGITTGDNPQYIRCWSEVEMQRIGLGTRSRQKTVGSSQHWYPLNSGGQFRKWFGNFDEVILWHNDGEAIRGRGNSNIRNQEFFFREGLTWGKITSSILSVRYVPTGCMFDAVGLMAFPDPEDLLHVLGLLNSNLVRVYTRALNPTLSMLIGDLVRIPFVSITGMASDALNESVFGLIEGARGDWDSYESSWDFKITPFLLPCFRKTDLAATYASLRTDWQSKTIEMQRLEEENNRIFIDAYGLQDELTPDVPLNEITLTCNPWYRYGGQGTVDDARWAVIGERWPEIGERLEQIAQEMAPQEPEARRLGLEQRLLADTMRELASYAVGCMFGRYSLDKPGLILANQGETVEDYVRKVNGNRYSVNGERDDRLPVTDHRSPFTFMPDRDNAIPILDGDWFEDDIVGRFRQFLRAAFGEERFADNLAFVEAALGRDLRSFFLREFYDDHLKRYKKRPIYWLFSSAKGSFNVLISMHRYRPDTVSVVLNGYLREFQAKLRARRGHLERLSISAAAAPRDKANALKEIDRLDKVLIELAQYENEVLYPLAARRLEIDLDDGVKVNYARFGAALKSIKGLSE